ncbi:hypothetical protein TrispH2_004635 [Trichoplax sp. H2]|nr:hypothetical protein TrispH2_004635 [Trichoplax sp. H2]|eukprot:RDD44239.1 hypothetical protein TrispH2_004635 [Trichoplax sp. H2]
MQCQSDITVPEPNPHWVNSSAIHSWFVAFQFHIYFFATCFGCVGIYALASIIAYGESIFKKRFYLAINFLLIFFALVRTVFLLYDPYESSNDLQRFGNTTQLLPVTTRVLHGIGYPCLTSAFTLIFLAIINCVKVKTVSKKLQHPAFIVSVITLHFAIVISADTAVAFCGGYKDLLIVCQSLFIIWGAIICISYLFCGYRILSFTKCNNKVLIVQSAAVSTSISTTTALSKASSRFKRLRKKSSVAPKSSAVCTSVKKVIRITMYSAILGISCIILNSYSLFGIYGVLAPPHFPAPWPWLMYQSLFRVTELGMALIMVYTTNRPLKKNARSSKNAALRTGDRRA